MKLLINLKIFLGLLLHVRCWKVVYFYMTSLIVTIIKRIMLRKITLSQSNIFMTKSKVEVITHLYLTKTPLMSSFSQRTFKRRIMVHVLLLLLFKLKLSADTLNFSISYFTFYCAFFTATMIISNCHEHPSWIYTDGKATHISISSKSIWWCLQPYSKEWYVY